MSVLNSIFAKVVHFKPAPLSKGELLIDILLPLTKVSVGLELGP